MIKQRDRNKMRRQRHLRVRRRVHGTGERPRMNVFRSLKHIYVQLIDDERRTTLVAASSLDPELREQLGRYGGNIAGAERVGELIARRAQASGITRVVFDRGGYRYHGRVASLAEAARKAGLEF